MKAASDRATRVCTDHSAVAHAMRARIRSIGRGALLVVAACTAVAMCTASARPAPPFLSAPTVTVPSPAVSALQSRFAFGDLDGDGRTDFAWWSGVLGAGLSLGNGHFAPMVYSRVDGGLGYPWVGCVIADLSGDGRPDLVASSWFRLGNGDGTFMLSEPYDPPGVVAAPCVGDVNGDGRNDLVIAFGDQIRCRPGLGGRFLDSMVTSQSEMELNSILLADVDGDGELDVVGSDGVAGFVTVLGHGDGEFGPSIAGGPGGKPNVGRLDDGPDPDLTCGRYVHRGLGTGQFALLDSTTFDVRALADLDLDGRLDLIGTDGVHACVARGHGDGHFDPAETLDAGRHLDDVDVGDVDGDGRPDLIATFDSRRAFAVYLNRLVGGFPRPTRSPAGHAPAAIASLDYDHDGHVDLVTADRGSRTLTLLRGAGDGTFSITTSSPIPAGARSMVITDLQVDGIPDVVVACDSANVVSITPLQPGPSFGIRQDIGAGAGPHALAIGALDGDPFPDVVIGSQDASIRVLESDVSQNLSVRVYSSGDYEFTPVACVAAADLDGDGPQDVVIGSGRISWDATDLRWLYGDGLGGVSPIERPWWDRASLAYEGHPGAIVAEDLDLDSIPELVVAMVADSAHSSGIQRGFVVEMRRSPSGGMERVEAPLEDWHSAVDPTTLAVGDVDGDGLPDAVVDRDGSGVVAVLPRLATGGFGAPLAWLAGRGATALLLVDVNEDGLLDIVTADSATDAVVAICSSNEVAEVPPDPAPGANSLRVLANPTTHVPRVAFTLAGASPARLELFDVSGRRLDSRDVGALGAGAHLVTLGEGRALSTGVYVVRLASAREARTARVAVVR